jgi:hypothetical protein
MLHLNSVIKQFIKKIKRDTKMYKNFIIAYLYETQYVSGDTPPIIRSLKMHWQPLVFHTWKVVWTCSWWTLSGTGLTTSTSYTPNNIPHMKNQMLPVQF